MKAVILIFTVFVLTISFNGYSLESSLTNDSVELIVDTNSESIVIDSSLNDLIESTEETMPAAILSGNIECLKWLKSIDCPWGYNAFERAGSNGDIHIMKWLFSQGCSWNGLTFSKLIYKFLNCYVRY